MEASVPSAKFANRPDSLLSAFRRIAQGLAVLAVLYFLAYFPTMSVIARHPAHRRLAIIWEPLPVSAQSFLLRAWSNMDPDGVILIFRYHFEDAMISRH